MHSLPVDTHPVNHMNSRGPPSANLPCGPNDVAIDSTVCVDHASASCANTTVGQQRSQEIVLFRNRTLSFELNPSLDAIKCQLDPDDCANAMQLIRKPCEWAFGCRLASPVHLPPAAIPCLAASTFFPLFFSRSRVAACSLAYKEAQINFCECLTDRDHSSRRVQ